MRSKRRVLLTVLDGVGVRKDNIGNAFANAYTPNLEFIQREGLYTTIAAHGKAVGLISDSDMGNSEVGHNAIGAGRVFDQGAKLVTNAIQSKAVFEGQCWRDLVKYLQNSRGTLHLIGLLSDGNVHSHEAHLHALLDQAKNQGLPRVRIHCLIDGRDVPEKSAEVYVDRLTKKMKSLNSPTFDVRIASGGGRMITTMDRYEADWRIVQRGWDAHVEGKAPHYFPNIQETIAFFRQDPALTDQYLPPFVITDPSGPVGRIVDGDAVVFFNFRGDRAIEISRAFTEPDLDKIKRDRFPRVFYAGMMQYDGDLKIPAHYLVEPPLIQDTMGEYLCTLGLRQFACSETQKFGHVTYFWNGNRSGKFAPRLEEYVEVMSDQIPFDQKPWMKAYEIAEETIKKIHGDAFDFGRINFANGDMVGHTGNYAAAIVGVATLDLMIGKIRKACDATGTILVITADHGNCEEMYENDDPGKPKTSHTLNPVPFIVYDPKGKGGYSLSQEKGGLGNIASTMIDLLGLPRKPEYLPSLIKETK
ncbi:MAG: 2,3-bisphosphoglycerate-independent phosphoglycerate mutase [Oligoflexales bacterium]